MVNKLTTIGVLSPFLNKPDEKLHLADISRQINAPHTTVRLWLNDLEKKGILKKEFKGRLTLYALKLDHPYIIDFLSLAEKSKLLMYCEKYPLFAELVSFVHLNYEKGMKILVFGSAATDFAKANDIDILVIGKSRIPKLTEFSKRINRKIHEINADKLNKLSKSFKIEVIKKHILITGTEDFVRWMFWSR